MSYLVQLKNKINPNEIADQVLLDSSTDIEKLTALTNALFQRSSKYIFYCKDKRIISTLEPIIESFDLNQEETIFIDFVDEKDIEADEVLETDDTVVSICCLKDKVFYSVYNGDVFEIGKNEKIFANITKLVAGSNLYGFDDFQIFNIFENKVIYTASEQIRAIYPSDSKIAVATEKSILLVDEIQNSVSVIADNQEISRGILISEDNLIWISEYNKINIFSLAEKSIQTFKTEFTLVDICSTPFGLVASTSNNKLVQLVNNSLIYDEVDMRLIQSIKYEESFIILVSQSTVLSSEINKDHSIKEKSMIKIDSNINDISLNSEYLYIANGNKISIFKRNRLL